MQIVLILREECCAKPQHQKGKKKKKTTLKPQALLARAAGLTLSRPLVGHKSDVSSKTFPNIFNENPLRLLPQTVFGALRGGRCNSKTRWRRRHVVDSQLCLVTCCGFKVSREEAHVLLIWNCPLVRQMAYWLDLPFELE